MIENLKRVFTDEIKLLTFRQVKLDISIVNSYLAFGFAFTWLSGIGRYWDNPKAEFWQYLGLGSVAYVFVLAFVLWVVIYPLKPKNWGYKNVLLFVTLTSPPAVLYAIPVERFMSFEAAQQINVWFLAVVAIWRVALLAVFLMRVAGLSRFTVLVATLLPLTLIVATLTALNLEHVVFRIMAGLEDHEKSVNDGAYAVLFIITYLSVMAFPVLLVLYGWLIYRVRNAIGT